MPPQCASSSDRPFNPMTQSRQRQMGAPTNRSLNSVAKCRNIRITYLETVEESLANSGSYRHMCPAPGRILQVYFIALPYEVSDENSIPYFSACDNQNRKKTRFPPSRFSVKRKKGLLFPFSKCYLTVIYQDALSHKRQCSRNRRFPDLVTVS